MKALFRALARFFSPESEPQAPPVSPPPPVPPTRVEELRAERIQMAYQRGMNALASRAPGMSDRDRLILARSIVMMLGKSIA